MTQVNPDTGARAPEKPLPPPPLSHAPDEHGRFGPYGGRYAPEALAGALESLERAYAEVCRDERFWEELRAVLASVAGRPTALTRADRLTKFARSRVHQGRGATIWLKREDLCHTGSEAINGAMGQALLARRMGKSRVIAETGSGQHGVAAASAAAHVGLACEVYMGEADAERQALNARRIELIGARVSVVPSGGLKDAMTEAMRDWLASSESSFLMPGAPVGPHPYPMIVRDFQSIVGREAKGQALRALERMPDAVVACAGRGMSAAGMFFAFVDEPKVKLHVVDAGGRGSGPGEHAAALLRGEPGVLHGSYSFALQDEAGQTLATTSCAAGLDYPGTGPELAFWKERGRIQVTAASDRQALDAFALLAKVEGILPSMEAAHAVAEAIRIAGEMGAEEHLLVCLGGGGDKDVSEAARLIGS